MSPYLTFEMAKIRQQELLREAAQFNRADELAARHYSPAWWTWIRQSLTAFRWSPRYAA